ncbi:MAG: sigma-70 family RNA polymerase sigma factor [Pirellulaceae bacterium]
MLYHWFGMDEDDAFQIACIGLIQAANKFDPTRGYQFSTSARFWLRSSCQRDGLKAAYLIRFPVHIFWPLYRLQFTERRLLASYGLPAARERQYRACKNQGISVRDWVTFDRVKSLQTFSDLERDEWDSLRSIKYPRRSPADRLLLKELRQEVVEGIARLNQREQNILHHRYGIGCAEQTLEEVAGIYSVTRERIRQIQSRAEEKLQIYLSQLDPGRDSPISETIAEEHNAEGQEESLDFQEIEPISELEFSVQADNVESPSDCDHNAVLLSESSSVPNTMTCEIKLSHTNILDEKMIPDPLVKIAEDVVERGQKRRAKVKTLLSWFGYARRREQVVEQINSALESLGLATEPSFVEGHYDSQVSFVPRSQAALVRTVTSLDQDETTQDQEIYLTRHLHIAGADSPRRAGWFFQQHDGFQDIDQSSASEAFSGGVIRDLATAIVREGIQNALDAQNGFTDEPVLVKISLGRCSKPAALHNRRWFEQLFPHLQLPDVGAPNAPRPVEQNNYLIFEDFNTKGLVGDYSAPYRPGQENNFVNFMYHDGITGKADRKLGSRGVGKIVFTMASRIRTIFAYTIRADDTERRPLLIGKNLLRFRN